MYTEVTRIRKPDPHVHEGDPNPVHTEVAKMAVFRSDICADLSGSWTFVLAESALVCTVASGCHLQLVSHCESKRRNALFHESVG